MALVEPGLSNVAVRAPEDLDLSEIFATLRRRKWMIITVTTLFTVLSLLYIRQVPPQYIAATLIVIEGRLPAIVQVEAVVEGLSIDNTTIGTQMEVLRSRGLMGKVAKQLNLKADPEFNPSLRPDKPPEWLASLKAWASVFQGSENSPQLPALDTSEEDLQNEQRVATIDAMLANLTVSTKELTRVISIEFQSQDPKKAALVANALADLYVYEQRAAKLDATRQAAAWLSGHVAELGTKVAASERKVEEFRKEHELFGDDNGIGLIAKDMSELNRTLVEASNTRVLAESRVEQVRSLVNSPSDVDAATEVLESPIVQRLRQQKVEFELTMAEIAKQHSFHHPDMRHLEAKLADIQTAVKTETQKALKRLENEVTLARVHEANLKKNVNALRQRLAEASNAAVEIGEFERDAEANRLLLKAFVSRYKETSAQQDIDFHQANARIISRADIPSGPAVPRTRAILAVVAFGSTFIGGLAALFMERKQNGLWSDVQAEEALGIPLLGSVPKIRSLAKMRRTPASYMLQHPRSPFAESIRSLGLTLIYFRLEAPPTTILLASSSPREGRTSMAVCLARAQALAGKKVVVIDADLRNPTIHHAFDMQAKPGLAEVLSGKALLDDVLRLDDATGARVIQAGLSIPGTSDILASPRFDELLSTLSKSYDLVILDSPPTLSGADAQILSARVDATVLIVRWGKTNRELAAQALKHFAEFQGRVVGAVLEMVDT